MTAAERRPPRFCLAAVLARRRASWALDAVLADLRPPAPPEPSSFGLEPEALRAEARRLHAAGWTTREITAVIDVSAVSR